MPRAVQGFHNTPPEVCGRSVFSAVVLHSILDSDTRRVASNRILDLDFLLIK